MSTTPPAEPTGHARERYSPMRNDPAKSCFVEVEGPLIEPMLDKALDVAAHFLQEPKEFLFVSSSSTATVSARERFRPNLDVERRPTKWRMTCTVKLDPAIVKERRHPEDRAEDEADEDDDV